jgi:seryl-tRNA synthetase
LPNSKKWLEISSCSNCTDFQSRRAKIRYKDKKTGKNKFVHTLNGSSLAVDRLIIAICEYYYEELEGKIKFPAILSKHMEN